MPLSVTRLDADGKDGVGHHSPHVRFRSASEHSERSSDQKSLGVMTEALLR